MKTQGKKLTNKQKMFTQEYQKDWNATRAAVAAGYSLNRPDRAGEIGYQLLQKTPIREAIQREMEKRLKRIGVHTERILTEIARVGLSDVRKLFREDGTLRPPHEWGDEVAAAVAGCEVFEEFAGRGEERTPIGHTKKVKVFDKVKALEILLKYLTVIRNGKHKDEEEKKDGGRVWTTLELSAKIVYLVRLAAQRKKEIEAKQAGELPSKIPGSQKKIDATQE